MPKLKAKTLEQYLDDVHGETAAELVDLMGRLGMSRDEVSGFVIAHANLNTNRFYETLKAEGGFNHDGMAKNVAERCRAWVKSHIPAAA